MHELLIVQILCLCLIRLPTLQCGSKLAEFKTNKVENTDTFIDTVTGKNIKSCRAEILTDTGTGKNTKSCRVDTLTDTDTCKITKSCMN